MKHEIQVKQDNIDEFAISQCNLLPFLGLQDVNFQTIAVFYVFQIFNGFLFILNANFAKNISSLLSRRRNIKLLNEFSSRKNLFNGIDQDPPPPFF